MLPAGVSASSLAMSSDMQMAMPIGGDAEMAMDDCCPDMTGTPAQTIGYKCGMGFCCVGGLVALDDVRPVAVGYFAVAASTIAIPEDQVVSVRGGSPPFRPPRI
nr:hypothetical protein [Bradyrhizobium japonicum]